MRDSHDDYVEDDFDDVEENDPATDETDEDETIPVFAEEDSEVFEVLDFEALAEMHPLMRLFKLRDMPGVVVTHHLPNHPGDVFYSDAEDPVLVLVGFRNEGSVPINVTSIAGSLNNANEYHYHMWNYTHTHYGQIVNPREEYTFSYTFHLHDLLDPVIYRSPLTVFYETEEHSFCTTFFNGTVVVKEPSTRVDVPMIMTWCILLSFLGGLLLFGYDFAQKRRHGKKHRPIIPGIVDKVLGVLGDSGNFAISKADSILTGSGTANKVEKRGSIKKRS